MRALVTALAAALAAIAMAAGTSGMALADTRGIVVKRDLSYGPLPEQTLTTCRPAMAGASKPLPGVVLIHGGGWVSMDKTDLMPFCKALARDGLFAATIDYRLVKKGDPTTRWPAQLADVQLALRWLRANAVAHGLDASRICAYGESAGGHLAVFLAAKKTIEASDMAALLADQPVSVVCAVDNFGPVDLTDPGPLKDLAELLLGKPLDVLTAAAFREASPVFLVDKDTAPIYIEQGSGDTLVQPRQSSKLFDALVESHVPARFMTYPGGHGWKDVPGPEQTFMADEERQFLRLFLAGATAKP